jgi:hypothetical protein
MSWGLDYSFGGANLDQTAGIHNSDSVGDLDRHTHIMCDEDYGHPEFPLQLPQQQDDLDLHRHVQRSSWFVGQQNGGTAGQR